jgi:hypothetical protein
MQRNSQLSDMGNGIVASLKRCHWFRSIPDVATFVVLLLPPQSSPFGHHAIGSVAYVHPNPAMGWKMN